MRSTLPKSTWLGTLHQRRRSHLGSNTNPDDACDAGWNGGRSGQLVALACQKFAVAILLLPDRKDADLDIVGFAVGLGFGFIEVASDRGITGDRNLEVGERERLDCRLPAHHTIDELRLVLNAPA